MPAPSRHDVDVDLAYPHPWERSRERSHARRLGALRRRRRRRGSRSVVLVLAAVLTFGAGGALAESTGDTGDMLKKGSRGPVVVQVQKKLGIASDGVFGSQTEKAVRRYQHRKGLTADGVVGPQTAGSLGVSLAVVRAQSIRAPSSASAPLPAILDTIAHCESGGDPHAVSSSGRYRGKYQFDRETWAAYGSAGDPARASEAEQDRRALALYRARGASPWPNCA
jgi:hypothetical protein